MAVLSLLVVCWRGGWLWKEVFRDIVRPDHVLVDKDLVTDMEEGQRHFFEEPAATWIYDGEEGEARHYDSDDCTAVLWHHEAIDPDTGVRFPIEVVHFVLHPNRTFEKARKLRAEYQASGIVPVSGGCGGRCWDPHPGRFATKTEPVGQCDTKIWRRFEDGCEHFQWYDRCRSVWGEVVWTCCRH